MLRHARLPPGTAPPGANRNAAWRMARSPLVAFTDDDCRPPPDWLERALEACRRHPGAIVQGTTWADPREHNIETAPHHTSQRVRPPTSLAQCCNIVYPREVLEGVGGFSEDTFTGEDADLALRARKAGTEQVGSPGVLTYHAVVEHSLAGRLRGLRRWQDLPVLLKRHPEMRDEFTLWIFWRRTHAWLPFFLAGAWLGERRHPGWRALCVPWLMHGPPSHGSDPRGRLRTVLETPSALARDVTEFAVLATGSAKHRTLFV
jgi:GT2 family glycosyltransferase